MPDRGLGDAHEAELYRELIKELVDYAIFRINRNGQIESWNAGVERIFGYTEAEFLELTISALFAPEDRERGLPEEQLRHAIRDGRFDIEGWRVRKDGSRFLSDSVVRAITNEAGDLIGFAKIVHDVTERKLAEQESERLSATLIAKNAKLQGANAELASFAYEVAHDIRLPVRGVCLYAELLARSIGTASQKAQSELVDILIQSSQELQHLVDSLLEYAALAKEVEAPESVALDDVLQEVRENLSAAIAETDADFSWGWLPVVKSYRVRMVRLLQNLVSNAIKYARPGTRPVIYVSAELGDREWQFAVSDNGRGVGPEFRESIFAPLKRLHGSDIPGTGLGLAICRRIVEGEGGRIWVDAPSGAGSTFYFTLPVDAG